MNNIKEQFSTKYIMKYRNELYGIAIVLIAIYHLGRTTWTPFFAEQYKITGDIFFAYMKNFIENFRAGVDLFVFLSPIGLYRSMSKNKIGTFYFNRFKRVVIPVLIIFIPYFIWVDFFVREPNVLMFLGDISTVNFWILDVPYSFWYVAFTIVMYALYPLIYFLDKKTKHISTIILFVFTICFTIHINILISPYTKMIECLLSRLPVFFLGVLLSKFLNEDHKIHWSIVLVSFILWGVALWQLLVWGDNYCFRFIGSAFAVLSVITFSFLMKAGKKVMYILNTPFRFIGGYSLEVYILHLVYYNIIRVNEDAGNLTWDIMPGIAWISIGIACSVLVAMLVRVITNLFTGRYRKKVNVNASCS